MNSLALRQTFLLAFATTLFFSCNQKTANQTSQTPRPDIDITEQQQTTSDVTAVMNYTTYCSGCHGQKMEMFVDRDWNHGNTKPDLVKSISEGWVNGGMPSYDTTFTDKEIEELADFILEGIEKRKQYDVKKDEPPVFYSTKYHKVGLDEVVSGIDVPWGIKVDSKGLIYFTERKGTLKIAKLDGTIVEVAGVPKVRSVGQGGMLDVALDPNFEQNQMLYLSYSKQMEGDKSTTAVVRGILKEDQLTQVEEIFVALPAVPTQYHYGSRLVFDKEGYLYITVGDRGKRDDHPQYLTNSCGKVHRINADGSIPNDNPFYNNPEAVKSIFSYGHRNPQGMILNNATGELWVNEHGPRGGDELNKVSKGTNYGWPVISYGINYNGTTFTDKTSQAGMAQPINFWIPSIAPSGMAYIDSDKYPRWKGDILSGSLRFHYVSRIRLDGDKVTEEEMILKGIGRVRSIELGADGYLYVGCEDPGRIMKVIPQIE